MKADSFPPNPRTRSVALAAFAIITAILVGVGYWYYQSEKEEVARDKYQTLFAIAELKAKQIQQWRKERLAEVERASKDALTRKAVSDVLTAAGDQNFQKELHECLQDELTGQDSSAALLVDTSGNLLASTDNDVGTVDAATQKAIREVIAGNKSVVSGFYSNSEGVIHIDLAAPVPDEHGQFQAVLVLRQEAGSYLYPLLEEWPTPSRSAETILAQRDGGEVVFLSKLRHRGDHPLSLRHPLTETQLPAVQAVLGKQGVFEGKDYRGVEVVSALLPVSDSPWFLETKVDAEEILSEARYRAGVIGVIIGLLIILTAGLIGFFYKQRQAGILNNLVKAERQKAEAQEREMKIGQQHQIILQMAMDGFCIVDVQGLIREVNDAYCRMTGYSEEELLAMHISDLETVESREETRAHIQKIITEGQDRFESRQRRKDGEFIDVEVSAQVKTADNVIVAFVRDITGQKTAGRKIKRLSMLYAALSETSQAIVRSKSADELLEQVCRIVVEQGEMKLAWIGMADVTGKVHVHAAYGPGIEYLSGIEVSSNAGDPRGAGPTGTAIREGKPFWCDLFQNDSRTSPWHERAARFGWKATAAIPLQLRGKTIGALTIYDDVSAVFDEDVRGLFVEMEKTIGFALDHFENEDEHKRGEVALRESEERLRAITDSAQDAIVMMDPEGRICFWNASSERIFGYTSAEALGKNLHALIAPTRFHAAHHAAFPSFLETGTGNAIGKTLDLEALRRDGTEICVHLSLSAIHMHGNWHAVGIIRDTTEQKRIEGDLRRSEARFRKYFELPLHGRCITSLEKGWLEVNDRLCAIMGYTREEILSKTWVEMTHPGDLAADVAQFDRILSGEIEHYKLEKRFIRKDGAVIWAEISAGCVRKSDGTVDHFICVMEDISERKLAQAKLIRSEQLLRDSQETALIGHYINNLATGLWESSPTLDKLFGIDRDYVRDTDGWGNLMHPDDREKTVRYFLECLANQEPFRMDYRIIRPSDGELRWMAGYGGFEHDESGKVVRLVGCIQDITERKRTEGALLKAHLELEERVVKRTAELNQSKAHLQLLLDSTAEAIYGIDTHGDCTFCNPACLRMLGYGSEDELLGKNMHWQIHHKHADCTRFPVEECRIFRAFQENKASHVDDEVLWRADGTSFPAEYWSYPQRIDGVAVGAVVTFIDITERRRAEGMVLQNVARTEELARLKSRFVSMASHELRTPLANIMLTCDLLKNFGNAMPAERSQSVLSGLMTGVSSMVRTIDDLLLAGKIEEGRLPFTTAPFALLDFLKRCCNEGLPEPPSRIEIAFRDTGLNVMADERLLRHILKNLLENALKYSPDDSKVELGVEAGPDSLTLSVLDRGIGVPEAEREFLFDAFSRASNVGDKPGSGLGLFIAQKCAQAHGGQLRYTPQPNGSVFSITIPACGLNLSGVQTKQS